MYQKVSVDSANQTKIGAETELFIWRHKNNSCLCSWEPPLTNQIKKNSWKKSLCSKYDTAVNNLQHVKYAFILIDWLTLKIQCAAETEAERGNEEGFPCFLLNCKASPFVKDTRLITLIVAYFHGNSAPSNNLASLANDTERVIILVPG